MAKSFTDMNSKEGIMIVDAFNLAFRWKHQKATEFKDAFYQTIRSLQSSYKSAKIIITADDKGSSYRREIFPAYKANRRELQETQSDEEKEYFQVFIKEYLEALEMLREEGILVLQIEGVEADDIAGYICKNNPEHKIWLISSDRDWDLLLTENTHRFSYVTRKEYTLDNWFDHYDIDPEHYITYKCLIGDTSDNIPGVKLIGPKTAVKVVDQYGDIFDIYNQLPIERPYKYIKNLNEFGEQLLLNHQLMDIIAYCEDAIGPDGIKYIDEQLTMYEI